MWRKAANVIGFQLVWFGCMVGAGNGLPWLGPLACAIFVIATLAAGGQRRADLRLLLVALPLGIALDSAFAWSGWLRYAEAWPWITVAPLWIAALWAAFAMTLNHSMAFLRGRFWLAATLGLIGGPLAYWSAAGAFDAVSFGAPVAWVLIALALAWGALIPLIFRLDANLASRLHHEGNAA